MKHYKIILACVVAAGAAVIGLTLSSCASADNLNPRYGEGWGSPYGGSTVPPSSVPC